MNLITAINEANKNVAQLRHNWKTNDELIAHYKPFYEEVKDQCENLDFFISICIADFKMKQSGQNLIGGSIIKNSNTMNPEEEFMNQAIPAGQEDPKKNKNTLITKLISVFWDYFHILPSSVIDYLILNLLIPIPFYLVVLVLLCQRLLENGLSVAVKFLQNKLKKHGRN